MIPKSCESIMVRVWGLRPITTYQNAFLIYNPNAGKLNRKRDNLLQRTIDALKAHGHSSHRHTDRPVPGRQRRIARECIEKGADLILAAGGDGTINEVANGMVGVANSAGNSAGWNGERPGGGTRCRSDMARAAAKLARPDSRDASPSARLENAQEERHFLLMAGAGLGRDDRLQHRREAESVARESGVLGRRLQPVRPSAAGVRCAD